MSEPLRTWPVITLPISRGRKVRKKAHHAQRSRRMSRRLTVRRSPSWMRAKSLDLFADLGVGREVFRFDPLTAKAFGRFAFRGEVFGFDAFIHQASRFKGDGLTQFTLTHSFKAPLSGPSMRRGAGKANACPNYYIGRNLGRKFTIVPERREVASPYWSERPITCRESRLRQRIG